MKRALSLSFPPNTDSSSVISGTRNVVVLFVGVVGWGKMRLVKVSQGDWGFVQGRRGLVGCRRLVQMTESTRRRERKRSKQLSLFSYKGVVSSGHLTDPISDDSYDVPSHASPCAAEGAHAPSLLLRYCSRSPAPLHAAHSQ